MLAKVQFGQLSLRAFNINNTYKSIFAAVIYYRMCFPVVNPPNIAGLKIYGFVPYSK